MPPSISFHELNDDAPALLERLTAHPEGVVVTYEGSDVARIVPLSPEERAWRDALLSQGLDPDEDHSGDLRTDPPHEPSEPVEPDVDPVEPGEEPVIDPEEEPAPEPDRPYDPDPMEALTPLALPGATGQFDDPVGDGEKDRSIA